MTFLMAMMYIFIMFPILSLVAIFVFSLTSVFSVLGYYSYIEKQEKNIILIKNVYIISILLGSSMLFYNIEFLSDWLIIFVLFIFQMFLFSFLIAILSFIIKKKKHLNCLFLIISTMLLAFVYPVAIFVFVLLDFVIRKLMSKRDPEEIKKMFFY